MRSFVWLALCAILPCRAVDPNRTMSQYVRERWGPDRGFPRGPVYAINQTPDGYLWIGTEQGLVRFEGVHFQPTQPTGADTPLTHVLGLVTDSDGSLWLRLRRPTVLRYRDGAFEDVLKRANTAASISAIAKSPEGGVLAWALQGEPSAMLFRGGTPRTIASPSEFSRAPVLALAQTQNGDIWVGTRDAGLFRIKDGKTTAVETGLPDPKVNALAPAGRDQLWIGTDAGVVRWDGTKLTKAGVPPMLGGVQALAMIIDRDASLWVGTGTSGLIRVNASGAAALDERIGPQTRSITALFEDREGNIWAGGESGIERLRDSPFVSYSLLEGLPSDGANPVLVDTANRVWFPPVSGGLWWFHDDRHGQIRSDGLDRDLVYSLAGGESDLWVGRRGGGLTRLQLTGAAFTSRTYTERDGLAQDSVYAVEKMRDGAVWAGTLSGGVSKIENRRITTYRVANGLASNTVVSILEAADGTVWFATPNGVSAFSQGNWRTFSVRDGLPSNDVNCLLETRGSVVLAGTSQGLAFRVTGNFRIPERLPARLREPVYGLAEDHLGWLWIATANHVLRLNRDRLLSGSLGEGDIREFGIADGLRGTEGVKRHRSVIRDPAGRIWISLNMGISVIDPARLSIIGAPAIAQVESLTADGRAIPLAGDVRVRGTRQRVTLGFAGLSLSVPERVRFRYRLDPFDRDWSNPSNTPEAAYTNLTPGKYRFRLLASNRDGVWSGEEAVLAFTIEPGLMESWWFRSAGVLLLCGFGFLAYRVRLHQMTERMNVRFEERLAERTRIAQELHDTLLQGFLSASMQVHVAAGDVPAGSPAKPMLARALQLMTQVIDEGRNALRGLRGGNNSLSDLEDAFARVPQEFAAAGATSPEFRVIVEGEPRPLRPALRDEVYRIGREALVNAFRHARARHIEIELKYSRAFQVSVRDDGRGIDADIAKLGRDGHFGLAGMRERTDRIGAQLHLSSNPGAGTEITLIVPGRVAYERAST